MIRVKFNLKNKSEPKTSVIAIVRYANKPIKMATGVTVAPSTWNDKTQSIRETQRNLDAVNDNNELKNFAADLKAAYKRLVETSDGTPSFEDVKTALKAANNSKQSKTTTNRRKTTTNKKETTTLGAPKGKSHTLFQFIKWFIEDSQTRVTGRNLLVSKGGINNYILAENHLKLFRKYIGKNFSFEDIDKDFAEQYKAFLLTQCDLQPNTVQRRIKDLKCILNAATGYGCNSNMYYKNKDFNIQTVKTPAVYLDTNQLEVLYNFDFSGSPRLDRVRDLFIVGCWTGLRYSDYSKLKPNNIDGNNISLFTQKTNSLVVIPVHDTIKEILKKYGGEFPRPISIDKFNKYVKEVGRACGFNEKVARQQYVNGVLKNETLKTYELMSSHTARRSFATNMYKRKCPIKSIMAITGHSRTSTFMDYIKMDKKEHADVARQYF